jgi:hypothetical protein
MTKANVIFDKMNNIYGQIQSLKAEEGRGPEAVALCITDTFCTMISIHLVSEL